MHLKSLATAKYGIADTYTKYYSLSKGSITHINYLYLNNARCLPIPVHLPSVNITCICICFDGVVIAAQCTATFLRSIVLPRI